MSQTIRSQVNQRLDARNRERRDKPTTWSLNGFDVNQIGDTYILKRGSDTIRLQGEDSFNAFFRMID